MRKSQMISLMYVNTDSFFRSRILALLFVLLSMAYNGTAQNDYAVLKYWTYYSDAENDLYKYHCDLSFQYLDAREEKINSLKTKEDWLRRQAQTAEIYKKVIGPFPEKTPLNPVITGKVKKSGYIVEKLYFESMPGYKVTAAFFIPNGKLKNLPTVIFCSGHSDLGFRSPVYQKMILNLVNKGFAVFAFDPIGQGERQQYFDTDSGKSKFGSTREHSYPGAPLFINGSSAAKYMIWDGIRSVDYLLTRKEVDPDRIGITGRSGGGTQSAYIAAFDERILAAAPECYITSFEYLLKSRGPQDAEQNFYHGIKEGLDFADLLEIRAPKPALMITTTRDMFSIEGAKMTYSEVQKAYESFGEAQNLKMVEDDAGHESTEKNREAMYAFFQEHLNNPGSSEDLKIDLLETEELFVTETGQLSTSVDSKFLFDVNMDLTRENRQTLNKGRKSLQAHIKDVKKISQELTGFDEDAPGGNPVFSGRSGADGISLEKYIIELPNDRVLPFQLFRPVGPFDKFVMYLAEQNKEDNDQFFELPVRLAKSGYGVLVPSLPGYGELGPGYLKGDSEFNSTSYNQWYAGVLDGKSMTAVHAEAVREIMFMIKESEAFSSTEFAGISVGPFCSSLLHSSAFGSHFDKLLMIEPLLSFSSLVSEKEYDPSFIPFAVAGSMGNYDLADLMLVSDAENILLINPKNGNGRYADKNQVEEAYSFLSEYFESEDRADNFQVNISEPETSILNTILRTLED